MSPVKVGDIAVVAPDGPPDQDDQPTFVKARRVRSFDDVVDQVRAAIIDGSITAGERLPSERELAEQFGVSRATLREALRALEALGLIEIRVGARGGAFATEGPLDRAADALRGVVDVEVAARPQDAVRFRASFHADNATWARGSDDEVVLLRAAAVQGSREFLVALAGCTGMPLRVALATAVEADGRTRPGPALTAAQMKQVVDLLRRGRGPQCRTLLFRLLGGQDAERSR